MREREGGRETGGSGGGEEKEERWMIGKVERKERGGGGRKRGVKRSKRDVGERADEGMRGEGGVKRYICGVKGWKSNKDYLKSIARYVWGRKNKVKNKG